MKPQNLASYFRRITRDSGDVAYTLVDGAPEWLMEAVRDAHAGSMPCDWIWDTCHSVACAIDDGSFSDDDSLDEFADSNVDVYTKALYQWSADLCTSDLFSNAEEEAGELLGDESDLEKRMSVIQFCAIRFIAQVILQAVEAANEESSDE
jgi:hypothetical protein